MIYAVVVVIYATFASTGWFFGASFRYSGSITRGAFSGFQATPWGVMNAVDD
jgi:hypothetical protein